MKKKLTEKQAEKKGITLPSTKELNSLMKTSNADSMILLMRKKTDKGAVVGSAIHWNLTALGLMELSKHLHNILGSVALKIPKSKTVVKKVAKKVTKKTK